MLAALPIIIQVIAQLLAIVGISWFAFKLEKSGAADKAATAVGDIAQGTGKAAEATGKFAEAAGAGADQLTQSGLAGVFPLVLLFGGLMILMGRR